MFDVIKGKQEKKVKVLVYGVPKIGKTELCSKISGCIIADCEDGSFHVDAHKVRIGDYSQLREFFKWIVTKPEYPTVIIDSITAVEKFLADEICKEHGWDNLEAPGYGKGYQILKKGWQKLVAGLDFLNNSGKHVVLTGHAKSRTFADPIIDSYDRWEVDLHKDSLAYLNSKMDAILFYKWKTVAKSRKKDDNAQIAQSNGDREMYTQERPAFLAGNRFNLPFQLMNPTESLWKDIIKTGE